MNNQQDKFYEILHLYKFYELSDKDFWLKVKELFDNADQ